MFLFHFSSLATQSRPCNRRQAAVCFHKSKQKDGEEPRTNPPRHTTVENLLGNPASSTNYASPGYHTVNVLSKFLFATPAPLRSIRQEIIVSIAQSNSRRKCLQRCEIWRLRTIAYSEKNLAIAIFTSALIFVSRLSQVSFSFRPLDL